MRTTRDFYGWVAALPAGSDTLGDFVRAVRRTLDADLDPVIEIDFGFMHDPETGEELPPDKIGNEDHFSPQAEAVNRELVLLYARFVAHDDLDGSLRYEYRDAAEVRASDMLRDVRRADPDGFAKYIADLNEILNGSKDEGDG